MPAGAPPFFKSPEELEEAIQLYLDTTTGPKTITGLAYSLGFESRQSFYDYENRPEFSYTVKRARLFIESGYELRLFENANAGAIFALKNFGWSDKQEIDQKTEYSGTVNHNIDHSKLSDAALREIAALAGSRKD